jgi:methylglutaconyl-CoA hydratase
MPSSSSSDQNILVAPETLDAKVYEIVGELLKGGPAAVSIAKKLVRDEMEMTRDEAVDHTVKTISKVRVTPEAQEGLGAFLDKRPPKWP